MHEVRPQLTYKELLDFATYGIFNYQTNTHLSSAQAGSGITSPAAETTL